MKSITQLTKLLQAQKRLFMILLAVLTQTASAQNIGYWDDRFSANPASKWDYDSDSFIQAIAVTDNGDIYASGLLLEGNIIKWNGKGWSSFGSGIGPVYAFATVGNDIYVGGGFTKIDSIQANRVATYNRITQSWSAMETDGFNGINHQVDGYYHRVYALAVYENNLYVGGSFTAAGGLSATNIARWNISTKTWTSLGNGVNGEVYAIVVKNGEVYVGGYLSSAGGVPANNIAKWNGHEWSALGSGVNEQVLALTICGDDLYVGGDFTKAGRNNASGIAKWNTVNKVWSALGAGVSGGVSTLASDGRVVYAGSVVSFNYSGEMLIGSFSKWNPAKSCWSRVSDDRHAEGGSVSGSINGSVYSILTRGNDVYLGGKFNKAGGKPSQLFAIWHEPASPSPHAPAWSSVPDVTFREDRSTQIELYQYVTDTEHDLRGGLNFSATVINQQAGANSNDLQIKLQKVIMGPVGRYVYATFNSANDTSGIHTVVFTVTDACGASASDTIQVIIKPVNGPPIFAAVPELRFDEDKSLLHPIRNWYPFVTDKDHADSNLTFAVQAGKNVKAARQADNFRFSAPVNWFGKDTLQLIVKDPGKLADTTALLVTVNSVNDAPKISGLPDSLSFKKGAAAQLKIWDFVEDVETPDSLLNYGFSANDASLRLNFNPALRGMLTLTAPQFHGRAKLFVNIGDGKASARDTINVTVIFVNDPPVISALPGLTFEEDKSLLHPVRNWYPFVADNDHTDSTLAFAAVAGRKVSAVKQGNDFLFSAPPNWFGKDTLQLIVTDPGKFADTTALMLTVNSVNDTPKISGLPDSLIFKKDGSAQLELWDYVEDVETPDRQLTYTFSMSNPSLLKSFDHTTGVLVLTAPQFHGRVQLFINVSDTKAGAQDTVAVRVELPTGVASREPSLPTAFHLWPNSPNPFNPGTTIHFDTPHAGSVKLAVYTLRGEMVQTLFDGEMAAGSHQAHFDGRNLASGVYFYRMETGAYVMTRKMILQK